MRLLTIDAENSGCYGGEIRNMEYNTVDSAVTGCATLRDFMQWCYDHKITREEWLAAKQTGRADIKPRY